MKSFRNWLPQNFDANLLFLHNLSWWLDTQETARAEQPGHRIEDCPNAAACQSVRRLQLDAVKSNAEMSRDDMLHNNKRLEQYVSRQIHPISLYKPRPLHHLSSF
jgi:hypothetical protein